MNILSNLLGSLNIVTDLVEDLPIVGGVVSDLVDDLPLVGGVTDLVDGLPVVGAVTDLVDDLPVVGAVTDLVDGLPVLGTVTDLLDDLPLGLDILNGGAPVTGVVNTVEDLATDTVFPVLDQVAGTVDGLLGTVTGLVGGVVANPTSALGTVTGLVDSLDLPLVDDVLGIATDLTADLGVGGIVIDAGIGANANVEGNALAEINLTGVTDAVDGLTGGLLGDLLGGIL